MPPPSEMQARHAAALGQLAELGLALAADLQRRALAAEDDAGAAQLADSFHKVGRSVRQSLALEARLLREHDRAQREAFVEDERTRPLRIAKRQIEVRKAVERLIWTEVENDEEAEFGVQMLAEMIGREDDLDDDFLDVPVETLVQRIKDKILAMLAEDREVFDDFDLEGEAAAAAAAMTRPEPELRNSA
jgi:hypothetical protein